MGGSFSGDASSGNGAERKIVLSQYLGGAPVRIKLRTPILLIFQGNSLASGSPWRREVQSSPKYRPADRPLLFVRWAPRSPPGPAERGSKPRRRSQNPEGVSEIVSPWRIEDAAKYRRALTAEITSGQRRGRRWTAEEKARIVPESIEEGANVVHARPPTPT